MSDVNIRDTNPITLTALVTTSGGNSTVQVQYGSPPVTLGELSDLFSVMPASLTLHVSSTTVPSGCSLAGSGGGTWTSTSATALVGTMLIVEALSESFDFTIYVLDGLGLPVARVDPRIIVKKLSV